MRHLLDFNHLIYNISSNDFNLVSTNHLGDFHANEEKEIIQLKQQVIEGSKERNKLTEKYKELELQIQIQKNEYESKLAAKSKELQELRQKLDEINEKQKNEIQSQKEDLIDQCKESQYCNSIANLKKIEEIGYGNGSKVTKVLMAKYYALKEMINSSGNFKDIQYLIDEFKILNKFNHPNILKTYGIFVKDEKYPPSILLEYCPFNLEIAIKRKLLSKTQLAFSVYQIAEGMKYIHSRKIAHQNLSPSNILITEDGTIKLCDFKNLQKSESDDVYSFGNIVYFILSEGEIPGIKNDISLDEFPLLAHQLITACWTAEVDNRPTFKIICDVLEQNHYSLFLLSNQEESELLKIINEHKALILNF